MLTKIVEYYSDTIPSEGTIIEAKDLAKKEKVTIKLSWYVRYNGWHSVFVEKDSDVGEVLKQVPRVYGV